MGFCKFGCRTPCCLKKSYWAKNFNEVSVTYSRTCSLAQLHGSSEGFATLFMAIYHPHLSQVQPKKDSEGRPWGCSITKHWHKTRCIILNFFLEMHLRGHWISGFWIFSYFIPLISFFKKKFSMGAPREGSKTTWDGISK